LLVQVVAVEELAAVVEPVASVNPQATRLPNKATQLQLVVVVVAALSREQTAVTHHLQIFQQLLVVQPVVVREAKKQVIMADQAVVQAALAIKVKRVAQVMQVAIAQLKVSRVGQTLLPPVLLQAAVVLLR